MNFDIREKKVITNDKKQYKKIEYKLSKERKRQIKYICETINDIEILDKRIVLRMLATNDIEIFSEGTGTRSWFKFLPSDLLMSIYYFVKQTKTKTDIPV